MKARDRLYKKATECNCNPDLIMAVFDEAIAGMREEILQNISTPPSSQQCEMIRELNKTKGGEWTVWVEPEKIQGYTAEQWQEIIGGGYLCEFYNTIDNREYIHREAMRTFRNGDVSTTFVSKDGRNWTYCRPAQIKGVMRPIWVEPVDKTVTCHLFSANGVWKGERVWEDIVSTVATSYIEL
jgi:hypothetical protein